MYQNAANYHQRLLLVPWLWTSQFESNSYQVNLPEKLPTFSCYNASFCSFYSCWTRVLNDEILKQGLITYWPCTIAWIYYYFLIFMIFVSDKVKKSSVKHLSNVYRYVTCFTSIQWKLLAVDHCVIWTLN